MNDYEEPEVYWYLLKGKKEEGKKQTNPVARFNVCTEGRLGTEPRPSVSLQRAKQVVYRPASSG